MPNTMKDYGLLLEAITGARKTVICVTYPGNNFQPLFESANNHHELQSCDTRESTSTCRFVSLDKIVEKEQVNFTTNAIIFERLSLCSY